MMKMDGRDSVECQNWEKRDKIVILDVVKSLNDKIAIVAFFFKLERKQKRGGTSSSRFRFLEKLLSRFASDLTVGGLRDKKENCSTQRGLRVDTGIVSF